MYETLKHIYHKLRWINSIKVLDYIYYNFICTRVKRDQGVYIVPYKGAVIDIHKTARLEVCGKNLIIGANKIGDSKTETYIKLGRNAIWECTNGASLCYGSTVEVHDNAHLKSGYFFINVGSVIISAKKITLGEDVWIGRDCVIYDSDFHRMLNEDGSIRNIPKSVEINDHVWLTNHVMVQKGVIIAPNVVISPYTVIRKNVTSGELITNGTGQICVTDGIKWSSELI